MTPRNGSDANRDPAVGPPLVSTPKQRGGVTGKGFMPGRSGNPNGRARGDGLMRKLLLESFQQNEAQAMAALARRWSSPKFVQDMVELLAKLEGEFGKEVQRGQGARVIILDNRGPVPLDPATFRAAGEKRALETRAPQSEGGSRF